MTETQHPKFPEHHKATGMMNILREVVFGMEDGMVSTLGAVTGIALATNESFFVLLSGSVIIAVESISMGVGAYISSKTEIDTHKRKLKEEHIEITDFPEEERDELEQIYIRDGWPKKLAKIMADTASKDKNLFLTEMAYHELYITPDKMEAPTKKGLSMFFSYIIGGIIPLTAYFVFDTSTAVVFSIIVTLIGLFLLGVATTKFSKRKWWKAGLELLILAGLAAIVGYAVGQLVNIFLV
jgi:vacuolar iron transporter family protein